MTKKVRPARDPHGLLSAADHLNETLFVGYRYDRRLKELLASGSATGLRGFISEVATTHGIAEEVVDGFCVILTDIVWPATARRWPFKRDMATAYVLCGNLAEGKCWGYPLAQAVIDAGRLPVWLETVKS